MKKQSDLTASPSDHEYQIECEHVWKIFGDKASAAFEEIRTNGIDKAEA